MPRQARIHVPYALHHIIIRGIEWKRIFEDDKDREDFLERLSGLVEETMTPCYAWVHMTIHAHFLLPTGTVSVASIMRRLLTGYAVRFNKRHRRHGPFFQTVGNRKDIATISGPSGLQLVMGFHDEALFGKWRGYCSSRLRIQWRVIYQTVPEALLFRVVSITAHDYRRS